MPGGNVVFALLPLAAREAHKALQHYKDGDKNGGSDWQGDVPQSDNGGGSSPTTTEASLRTARGPSPYLNPNKVEQTQWDKDVMHAVTKDHGFTFHDHVGDGPTGGYMVSIQKQNEQAMPVRDVTPASMQDYISTHQADLKDPNNYLGGWVHRGNVYLDVSRHVDDRDQALRLAKANNQIGIYDLHNGATILTNAQQPQPQMQQAAALYRDSQQRLTSHYTLHPDGTVIDNVTGQPFMAAAKEKHEHVVHYPDGTYQTFVKTRPFSHAVALYDQDRHGEDPTWGVAAFRSSKEAAEKEAQSWREFHARAKADPVSYPHVHPHAQVAVIDLHPQKLGSVEAAVQTGESSLRGNGVEGTYKGAEPTYNLHQAAEQPCPGTGRKWQGGTGSPICPVCHRGWRSLGVSRPVVQKDVVPEHTRQVAEAAAENRRCESCNGAMPNRTHRQRRSSDGRLVCDSCARNPMPEWSTTHASLDVIAQSEMRRREAEAIISINRVRRMQYEAGGDKRTSDLQPGDVIAPQPGVKGGTVASVDYQGQRTGWVVSYQDGSSEPIYGNKVKTALRREAHDAGDNATINHCPFCGSGAVVGNSDGSASCDFCHNTFSVQVQPNHPFMPQTVDGQPYTPPGMPAGQPADLSDPTDPVADALDSDQDPGQQQPETGFPQAGPNSNGPVAPGQAPSKQPPPPGGTNAQPPGGGGPPLQQKKSEPPWLKGKGDDSGKSDSKDDDKSKGDGKKKNLPPWLKKKTSVGFRTAATAWQNAGEWSQNYDPSELTEDEVEYLNDQASSADEHHDIQRLLDNYRRRGKQSFRTASGATLDPDAYVAHLALEHADDRTAVLDAVRLENLVKSAALTKHRVLAEEVRQGDYLDSSGKVRVHNTHIRNDQVTLAWRLRGSKAPGVRSHQVGESVHVWRRD